MQLIRGVQGITAADQHAIVTIGNFDGIHRGHQALLKHVKYLSFGHKKKALVIVFEPQPQEFFLRRKYFTRLSTLRDKAIDFMDYEIDRLLILPFNDQLAKLSAEDFVQNILVKYLKVDHLVVGDDFHFGADRKGNIDYLKQMAKQYNFSLEVPESVSWRKQRVSSTLIRESLQANKLNVAEELLGHPYRVCGRVVKGDGRGRKIGCPTANVHIPPGGLSVRGVYAVKVEGVTPKAIFGVANIGTRPTIGGHRIQFEVHLFDFKQDIYDCRMRVNFFKKLRDEVEFSSVRALKKQIEQDIQMAKDFFLE
ncbi:MAG: riboflavin biosynthesis protein RibF [Gammaproteobacteria bacterium RIFCSPHIGHO2_02_FULL_42_13]|nr:MAG: riboflavin biosynthesis protein RibF [Gammaproteobacteria bacterium RIFCSPHIGHO2_02_FULL_42_13]OGT69830.1 MAG: riboflavin biosynthesis protein RibF [Gammaproteobacteria bacterium RIFCSPLOWO2_02_FULL_42_9]